MFTNVFELAVFSNQPDYTSLSEEVNFLLITYMSIRILSTTAKFNHFDFVVSLVVTISRKSLKYRTFYKPSRSKCGEFATVISCIEIHKISLVFLGKLSLLHNFASSQNVTKPPLISLAHMIRHWTPNPLIICSIRSSPTGGNFFLLLLNHLNTKLPFLPTLYRL